MKEIKYRAKVIDQKTDKWIWIYRQPFQIRGTWYMYNSLWDKVRIDHKTISQYTGLKDKNGKEIYEGDIVRHATDEGVYKVIFEDGGFYVKNLFEYDFQTIDEYPLEVIGNTYENPELLEESK